MGAGLWNSFAGTFIVEAGMFAAGVALYVRTTRRKDRTGVYAFWSLIAVIFAMYCGNLFSPPPPSAEAIAIAGNGAWLFVLWAYWADSHRTTEGVPV